ncbi:MAG: glucose 1-dehydrogenase [Myxococcota bacterium]
MIIDRYRLDGKVAVVTGGTRGIGFAIAQALAEQGAQLVVSSRSDDASKAAANELGGAAIGIGCDVTDGAAVEALVAGAVEAKGGVDILVHSAGVASGTKASAVRRAELQQMMAIHLEGGVHAAQLAADSMESRKGGAVLFIGSVFGLGGVSHTLAYGAAKAALGHATKVLAVEWARRGIRVNALAPGFVETAMTADLDEGARAKLLRKVPLRRAASPEEMAAAALFLCTPAASYITGQTLVADGGERAR